MPTTDELVNRLMREIREIQSRIARVEQGRIGVNSMTLGDGTGKIVYQFASGNASENDTYPAFVLDTEEHGYGYSGPVRIRDRSGTEIALLPRLDDLDSQADGANKAFVLDAAPGNADLCFLIVAKASSGTVRGGAVVYVNGVHFTLSSNTATLVAAVSAPASGDLVRAFYWE